MAGRGDRAGRGGRTGRGIIAGPFPYPGRGQGINQEGVPLPPVPIQAEVANTFPNPPTELSSVLRNLGFPAPIVRYMHDVERLNTLQDVNAIQRDLVTQLFEGMRVHEPPVVYTTLQLQLSKFKTLNSYLKRMAASRTPINPASIDNQLLVNEMDYVDAHIGKEPDRKVPFPSEQFKKPDEWLTFRDTFKNSLDSVPSTRRSVPLSYVIRPSQPPQGAETSDPYWTIGLEGGPFKEDARMVYTYLVKLCSLGPGRNIVLQYASTTDGRSAFEALNNQFTGGSYKTLLLNKAWSTLTTTKYLGHINYSWFQFQSDIDGAFRQLGEAKVTLDDSSKVYHLLNAIQVDYLCESVNQVRQTLGNNYKDACVYLANAVLTVLSRNASRVKNKRSVAKLETRKYSNREWRALTDEEKDEVRRLRAEQDNTSAKGRGPGSDMSRGSGGEGRFPN